MGKMLVDGCMDGVFGMLPLRKYSLLESHPIQRHRHRRHFLRARQRVKRAASFFFPFLLFGFVLVPPSLSLSLLLHFEIDIYSTLVSIDRLATVKFSGNT